MESVGLDSGPQQTVDDMAKAVSEIEREIRELSPEERAELLRSLIADLDAPVDANVERAWLETSQRRYRELVEGKVKGVPGPLVFDRLRKRLGG
jgi:acyl-CoA reductase-like NAD-dependent aldehyde dehydrogenase